MTYNPKFRKFRKIPIIVEAVEWEGSNIVEVCQFMGKLLDEIAVPPYTESVIIKPLEGDMIAKKGDFIIKGIKGEFYPVKPDIFNASYEEIVPVKEL